MTRNATAAAQLSEPDRSELVAVDIPPAARHPKVRMITRSQIHPDPDQPRQQADAELRDSLARNGMVQPITVRPHPSILTEFMIVDGERRWMSAAGVMEDLPCIVRQDMDELSRRLATQLEANTGKALTPVEEAKAFARLIDDSGMSVAELAEYLGRAKSTVAERVALLELGPWLPLIESGRVVLSHAVKALLPYRQIADEIHAKVIEEAEGAVLLDGDESVTLEEFTATVQRAFRPYLYPLAKSKQYGAKNPEFNTAKHDAECACGRIQVQEGYPQRDRAYCGNPDWWKPLDKAAKKAKKAREADSPTAAQKGGKTLYLPAGAKTVESSYGSAPSGVVQLTDSNGDWNVSRYSGSEDLGFDPADLVIDAKKLVQWTGGYGGGEYPRVGTTDAAAVKTAREKWTARWNAEYKTLVEEFGRQLQERRLAHRVEGPGALAVLTLLDRDAITAAIDIARALAWTIPGGVLKDDYNQVDRAAKWLSELSATKAALMLSCLATLTSTEIKLPSAQLAQLQQKAKDGIRKRTIPWKAKPKAGAKGKAAAKKTPAKADKRLPLSKLSDETAELPLTDERNPAESFDDDDEGEGWASAPAADDEDGGDLWDSTDDADDLEEAEA